jgi:hypothetical protein
MNHSEVLETQGDYPQQIDDGEELAMAAPRVETPCRY